MFFKPKKAVKALVDHLEQQPKGDEIELINRFLIEARELIEYNEWGLALQNLLEQLHEIDYKLDEEALKFVHRSLAEMKIDPNNWGFLEEMKE